MFPAIMYVLIGLGKTQNAENQPCFFSGSYFGPDFFQGHKPTHVFKTRIVGAD